jgi:hypothetical protein
LGKKTAPKNNIKEDKSPLAELPLDLLSEVAIAYKYGIFKYFRLSWRMGFKTSDSLDAVLRHISEFKDKSQEYDKEAFELTGQKVHHIGMAIFNLLCVLDACKNHRELINTYVPENYKPDVPIPKNILYSILRRRKAWEEKHSKDSSKK